LAVWQDSKKLKPARSQRSVGGLLGGLGGQQQTTTPNQPDVSDLLGGLLGGLGGQQQAATPSQPDTNDLLGGLLGGLTGSGSSQTVLVVE
jgi:hypothetical protein